MDSFTTIELCAGVGMLGEGLRAMKSIPGFEGKYSATEDGRIYSHVSGKFLKQAPSGGGGAYRHVSLGSGNSRNVHVLVLITFCGPAPAGHVARHLDGNGHNNHIENLQWATQKVNVMDKLKHGTMVQGEAHHFCVLPDVEVLSLRRLRSKGWSYPQLAERFGISTSQAHRIGSGQNRKGI